MLFIHKANFITNVITKSLIIFFGDSRNVFCENVRFFVKTFFAKSIIMLIDDENVSDIGNENGDENYGTPPHPLREGH